MPRIKTLHVVVGAVAALTAPAANAGALPGDPPVGDSCQQLVGADRHLGAALEALQNAFTRNYQPTYGVMIAGSGFHYMWNISRQFRNENADLAALNASLDKIVHDAHHVTDTQQAFDPISDEDQDLLNNDADTVLASYQNFLNSSC